MPVGSIDIRETVTMYFDTLSKLKSGMGTAAIKRLIATYRWLLFFFFGLSALVAL